MKNLIAVGVGIVYAGRTMGIYKPAKTYGGEIVMGRLRSGILKAISGCVFGILMVMVTQTAFAYSAGASAGSGLEMEKTVSDDGSCGKTDVITVTWKTSLTYCYTATNTGTVTLTTHTLTDTVLVSILDGFTYELAPQVTMMVTATFDPPNVPGPLENCALWTAQGDDGVTAQAADCATVYLLAPTTVSISDLEVDYLVGYENSMVGIVFITLLGVGLAGRWRAMHKRK